MWMRLSRLGCRDSTRREHGRHLFTRKLASGQGCRLGRGLFSKGRRSRGRRLPHSQIRVPRVVWETHGATFSPEGEG